MDPRREFRKSLQSRRAGERGTVTVAAGIQIVIEREPGPDWRDLQRRVVAILAECGFAAEEAKQLPIARGEVDVYAIDRAGTHAVASVFVRLNFAPEQPLRFSREISTYGRPYTCEVLVISSSGATRMSRYTGRCAPHDPKSEHRSTRAAASASPWYKRLFK